ncbi:MAG: SdiA-regulated domain-containing protein [Deltaproteobacteria bacterium]|nr:SdiA-regulated domain-containing protein [Deltaproteobacteria bacterium]MDQ3295542.1 SdiA-regulated domain-containing protein [Myxococcota bacterium]
MFGRTASLLLVASAAACAAGEPGEIEPFYESSKADGNRPRLRVIDDDRLHVDEPSDLVRVGDQLYTVSDVRSKIYAITRGGNVEEEIDVEGQDLEAIAYDRHHDELVIADEATGKIWRVGFDGKRHDSIEIEGADDGNSGIEGLTFDDDDHLFVAKEKDPARIYELGRDGEVLHDKKIDFTEDLSALSWNPQDGHLYALGDHDHALYQLDHDLDVVYSWRLPIEHPEGLAFDGDRLFIVSDSDERIYEFELATD